MHPEQQLSSEQQIHSGEAQIIREDGLLEQALSIMQSEQLSSGGNIRDKTMVDIRTLLASGGQVWGWIENHRTLSVCTLEPFIGNYPWWYLNNGVTKPEARGLGLSGRLIASAMRLNDQPGVGFIVIYVRQGLFERQGFIEVTVPQLASIDKKIARVIDGKLRSGKPSHIFIKNSVRTVETML